MDIKLTLRKALEIQAKQLDHYCTDKPYSDTIRAEIASKTNVENLDLDEELPAHIVNRHVPRGGAIESAVYREKERAAQADIQPTPQFIDRELDEIKNFNRFQLQVVRLTTTSGHSWKTNIASAMTEQDAIDYFLNQQFDVSSDPDIEQFEEVVRVEYNPEV
jgi:hypothetical protein